MTINLPKELETSVHAEVLSGHFPSEDDLIAAAVRAFLGQQPQAKEHLTDKPSGMGSTAATHDDDFLGEIAEQLMKNRHTEPNSQKLQHHLLEGQTISEIKPPVTDLAPDQNRQVVSTHGEPLSVTIRRERR